MTIDELLNPGLTAYKQNVTATLAKYVYPDTTSSDIIGMKREFTERQAIYQQLVQAKPDDFHFSFNESIQKWISPQISAYKAKVEAVKQKYASELKKRQSEHDSAVQAAEDKARASTSTLEKKYDELLSYKDKIADAVLRYDIKPSSMAINTEACDRQEMESLCDIALDACKYLGAPSIRQKLKPLYEFPKEVEGRDNRLYMIIGIGFVTLALAPIALALMFGYQLRNTKKVFSKIKGLQVADSLMYGIDFSKYRDAVDLSGVSEVDSTDLDEEQKKELAELEKQNPELAVEQLRRDFVKQAMALDDKLESTSAWARELHAKTCSSYKAKLDALEAAINDYLSKAKKLGENWTTSPVFDTNFILGKTEEVVDVKYDIGFKNIVFRDVPGMTDFIRLMLCNALMNVRPQCLQVYIYDPERLGADYPLFLNKEYGDNIRIVTKNFESMFEDARNYQTESIRILRGRNINEFNNEAEEKKMITRNYRLYILASGCKDMKDNAMFKEFMSQSAEKGIFMWIVNQEQEFPNTTLYSKPFEGVETPYPVDEETYVRTAEGYLEAWKKAPKGGINYFEAFADKYIPRSKWWTENTDRGIKINVGLQDGDPNKGYDLVLGDANVHGLCVGTTGAGKSVFNNQLIASLITRYPPSALELILIDFKNIEFGNLVNKETHYSRIPHASIIAGTTDGEYVISVFNHLLEEMNRRTRIFSAADAKKLEDYNKKMREQGTPEKCLPRVLLIIDEFQVMFGMAPKQVEQVNKGITSLSKLARFCGCHMLFTSQSMKGTMNKDTMNQFSLRVALRCTSDTSTDIIGVPAAANMPSKFGYVYTNENSGETQQSTRFWRTPFLDDPLFYDTKKREMKNAKAQAEGKPIPFPNPPLLDEMPPLLLKFHETDRRAYFYDEKQTYEDSVLREFIDAHKDLYGPDTRMFTLGERTDFSTNTAPVNFSMIRGDGEHILLYAFESADFYNLLNTLIMNIQATQDASLVINCADLDAFNILELDEWYNPAMLDIARPQMDPEEWVSTLETMLDARESKPREELKPLYFFAIRWDKQSGIYMSPNYKIAERWEKCILRAGALDVHFVIACQTYRDVPVGLTSRCSHIIVAKGPSQASNKFLENERAARLPDDLGFAIYRYGQKEVKFKVYQHKFARKPIEREVKL